jgi:hypothetical protein
MSTTSNRQFPSPYPFNFDLSPERRKYNRAMNGIVTSERTIGYYTEEMAKYDAQGTLADRWSERERQYSLKLCRDNIAINQRELAEHHKALAEFPDETAWYREMLQASK